MDQFDPWQVFPRQVFIHYYRQLISTAFVVVSRVGFLGVTGEVININDMYEYMYTAMTFPDIFHLHDFLLLPWMLITWF